MCLHFGFVIFHKMSVKLTPGYVFPQKILYNRDETLGPQCYNIYHLERWAGVFVTNTEPFNFISPYLSSIKYLTKIVNR